MLLPHLGLRVPGARAARQGDRGVRGGAQARRRTIRSIAGYLIRGQHRGEEVRGGRRRWRRRRAPSVPTICGSRGSRRRRCARRARPTRASPLLEELRAAARATIRRRTSRSRRSTRTPSAARRPCKLLQDAQAKFPARHDDPVRARRGVRQAEEVRGRRGGVPAGARADPDNAPALNYLGYMLAERGERLDESVAT